MFFNGEILDQRYCIKKYLAEGGMSHVYLAFDKILNETICIKSISWPNEDDNNYKTIINRIQREIIILSKIRNQNIIHFYDVFNYKDFICIVMEYVNGTNLKKVISDKNGLLFSEGIDIFKQILSGMIEVHKKNIIHRDLKPQNILITNSGLVKITDFGIALIEGEKHYTKSQNIVGSLQYMAPENLEKKISKKLDIYSLGIILYELFTNTLPYRGKNNIYNHFFNVKNSDILDVSQINFKIPKEIDAIIRKCIHLDVNKRYNNCEEILVDINCIERKTPLIFAITKSKNNFWSKIIFWKRKKNES
ncbi:serine/threonine protein kinase [symbiont of Argiope bruennichi]|uniref:serine/threonine-protein kinase n=1 Tax=symbiont of Argiope bruennichi TaxID=2810479 RepID=UPI003DA24816